MRIRVWFKHRRDAPMAGSVVDYCDSLWKVATVLHGSTEDKPCIVFLSRLNAPKKAMVFLHSGTQS